MRKKDLKTPLGGYVFIILCAAMVFTPVGGMAENWWDVTPEEENPSPLYDSILYSDIAPTLHEIEQNTDRLKVEVIGQSAGGRNLFLATIASNGARDRLKYFKFYKMMSREPEKALQMLDDGYDFKVPVFINGSIHGNEYPGTDASVRMIRTLAYEDTDETRAILENMIVLFNVCQNPDGRVLGTRRNSNNVDLNRDFITQSQPESRITAGLVAKWNPLIFLDLHDDVEPMLIEPCSPPHNSSYEYDLYIRWAYDQALAMEAELMLQTGFEAQIPYRDWEIGWDDWPPIYGAMYPMYHGAYGHTLETPYEDITGVDAHYAAVWGALKFVAENKREMLRDQTTVFWRGVNEQQQQLISDEMLAVTEFDQFNEFTITEFPAAYVIPADASMQLSSHQPAELVDFLIFNGVDVESATQPFTLDGVEYPAGTYVIWMNQAKRSLANTILEDGQDVSYLAEDMIFYSPPSAWSHPLLWGVGRAVMQDKTPVSTVPVKKATAPLGSVEAGSAGAYAYSPGNIAAVQATNALLARGVTMHRAEAPFEDAGKVFEAGTFIIPANAAVAGELANDYGLVVSALTAVPEGVTAMKRQRIAVYANEGMILCLKELGFGFNEIDSLDEMNETILSEYDVFINNRIRWDALDEENYPEGRAQVISFFENGGDYIGVLDQGISFGVDAGLMNATYTASEAGDAIADIDYASADSVGAGFPENGYAYVLEPVYFTEIPEGVRVSASIDAGDFLVSGFWPGWRESGANGMPVIVHQTTGTQDVTFIGIEPTFRGHPRNTFRIIANAIYDALD